LLECAGQLSGGYFADPPYKDVPDLDRIGFPLAEVAEDASAVLTKAEDSGGVINMQTCREQLLYEVFNPSAYVTPDVTADFTGVHFEQEGPNRMRVSGGKGSTRPGDYKISIGVDDGFMAEGQISYAGPGALARAELARNVLEKRLGWVCISEVRFDILGVNAVLNAPRDWPAPYEVRLRAAGHFKNETDAKRLVREVESLYLNGPAGGCGIASSVRENIAIAPAVLAREASTPTFCVEEA